MSKLAENKNNIELYGYIKWYPILNVICELIATVNRVYELLTESNNKILPIIQAVTDSSEGFFFMIIFLTSPGISQSLAVLCRRLFGKGIDDGANIGPFDEDDMFVGDEEEEKNEEDDGMNNNENYYEDEEEEKYQENDKNSNEDGLLEA